MTSQKTTTHIDTTVVHAGAQCDPTSGAVTPPIYQTSTFRQQAPGIHQGWDYSRAGNPTRDLFEQALAALEQAKFAMAFSSGLAAEQAIIQTLNPGDQVLVCDDVYGGTGRLFRRLFAKYNIDFKFIDMTNLALVTQSVSPQTKMFWIETPTNPMMKIIDIAEIATIAQKAGSVLVVDNTFATPIFQNPLSLGASIVIHSTTKYIGGHSDLVGGAVMVNDQKLADDIRFIQFAAGSVPSPFESFLLHRSIKTLAVRMAKHDSNAREVADFLSKHPKIEKVFYPGLPEHPGHAVAVKQMRGFSGMLSCVLKGDYLETLKFLKQLKVFTLAESLGGVESLVNHPEKMTHASVPEALRKELGISSNLVRLSVGIENPNDIIGDLSDALEG